MRKTVTGLFAFIFGFTFLVLHTNHQVIAYLALALLFASLFVHDHGQGARSKREALEEANKAFRKRRY